MEKLEYLRMYVVVQRRDVFSNFFCVPAKSTRYSRQSEGCPAKHKSFHIEDWEILSCAVRIAMNIYGVYCGVHSTILDMPSSIARLCRLL